MAARMATMATTQMSHRGTNDCGASMAASYHGGLEERELRRANWTRGDFGAADPAACFHLSAQDPVRLLSRPHPAAVESGACAQAARPLNQQPDGPSKSN